MERLLYPGDRIYVAARYERKAEALALADELVAAGFKVTSRWLLSPGLQLGDPKGCEEWSVRDLEDVDRAHVYMLLSDEVLGRGGKDFEGGYAYAKNLRIIVVGQPAHVFHFLPGVQRIEMEAFRARYLAKKKQLSDGKSTAGQETDGQEEST
jgi:hypothetical protein